MKYIFSLILLLTLLPLGSSGAISDNGTEWTTFKNGELWYDDDGNLVQAHAPGFLHYQDIWYMVGEDRTDPGRPDVNLYSSKDLRHWHFEGKIIKNEVTTPELGRTRFVERAKILYNEKYGKFVIWCHWEGEGYRASEAACFVSDNIRGPYSLAWSGRPQGIKSRDCNIFTDGKGKAWFISTTSENQDLGLFELSDDYLSTISHTVILPGLKREAPAVVKVKGKYFMLSSACTGWAPNQCKVCYSKHLDKGWSELENIGDSVAFRTQAAAILTIKGTKQTTYLYVGDRWKDPTLAETKTIIFPIRFEGNKCIFEYCDEFSINFSTGEVRTSRENR